MSTSTHVDTESSCILEIKTVQASTFKQIVDALKEILIDVNMEFDESGMKIVALDNTHVVLVHLRLDAERFESFYCEKKMFVGINVIKLNMLMKTITNNDMLTLYVDREDPNRLGIRIENSEKKTRTVYKLNMLDLNVDNIHIPPAELDTVISLNSQELQRIVRDMSHLADVMEIRVVGNQLCFSCKGDAATQETVLSLDRNDTTILKHSDPHTIIQGVYSLKYLSSFCKCAALCPNVEVALKNSFPIILVYQISSLGSIRLCLAEQV
jgi:proliferating cell nuclear antigen